MYNGLGHRIAKIVNGVRTNFLVDPNGILPQVLAETDTSGTLIAFYVYDGVGLVAKVSPSGEHYFYYYDGLDSTIAITDQTANVVNSYAYTPYGAVIASQEQIPNPSKYVGRYGVMDEGNGLYFMRARYYNPDVGRFVSKGPIGYAGGMNLYAYCLNNPVNWVDPLGLEFYGAANAGFAGFNYSASTQNPSQASLTTDSGVIVGGSLSVGYDFGKGIFDDLTHDLLGQDSVNIGLGKYLGITVTPDLSKVQFNIGFGLALPVSYSVPIRDGNWEPLDATFGDDLYDYLHDDPCK